MCYFWDEFNCKKKFYYDNGKFVSKNIQFPDVLGKQEKFGQKYIAIWCILGHVLYCKNNFVYGFYLSTDDFYIKIE